MGVEVERWQDVASCDWPATCTRVSFGSYQLQLQDRLQFQTLQLWEVCFVLFPCMWAMQRSAVLQCRTSWGRFWVTFLRVYLPLWIRSKLLLLMWSISLEIEIVFYKIFIIVRSLPAGVLVRIQLKCSNTLPFLPIILHFYIHRIFSIKVITNIFKLCYCYT